MPMQNCKQLKAKNEKQKSKMKNKRNGKKLKQL